MREEGVEMAKFLKSKLEKNKKQKYRDNSVESRTEAKQRYNEKNYASIHVHLDKELVYLFRDLCKAEKVSQAEIIKKSIEKFISESFKKYEEEKREKSAYEKLKYMSKQFYEKTKKNED